MGDESGFMKLGHSLHFPRERDVNLGDRCPGPDWPIAVQVGAGAEAGADTPRSPP